jgi:MSHA pilin protein MshD
MSAKETLKKRRSVVPATAGTQFFKNKIGPPPSRGNVTLECLSRGRLLQTFPKERGLTLIEVVVFIAVLAIGIAAILVLYNRVTEASVDPMVRKQAVALAASLLEEVELHGYTYCDPDDANVYTASAPGSCAQVENLGPEGETRSGTPRFDNVNDYQGFSMAGAGMQSADGTVLTGLSAYTASVAIAQISPAELGPAIPDTEALRITVTVSGPAGVNVSLQGYRVRYAPNAP